MNYFGMFYDRSMEFVQRSRFTERKAKKRQIRFQRDLAFMEKGCGGDELNCAYPNCFCYPLWKNTNRRTEYAKAKTRHQRT